VAVGFQQDGADVDLTLDRDLGVTGPATFTGGYSYLLDSSDMDTLTVDQDRASFTVEQRDMNLDNVRQATGCVATGMSLKADGERVWLEFPIQMHKIVNNSTTLTSPTTAWTQPAFMDAHNFDVRVNTGSSVLNIGSVSDVTFELELSSVYEADLTGDQGRGGAIINMITPKINIKTAHDAGASNWYAAFAANSKVAISVIISPSGTATSGDIIGIYLPSVQLNQDPVASDEDLLMLEAAGMALNTAGGDAVVSFG